MSWNYRVCKRTYPNGDVTYGIVEAYSGVETEADKNPSRLYTIEEAMSGNVDVDDEPDTRDHTKIANITLDFMDLRGGALEELHEDMSLMMEAFEKPVIDYDDYLGKEMV